MSDRDTGGSQDAGGALLAGVLVGVVAAAGVSLWLAARLACLGGACMPRRSPVAAALWMMLGRPPARAWDAEGMSTGAFWTLAVLIFGVVVAGVVAVLVRLRGRLGGGRLRPAGGHGLATARDVRRHFSAAAIAAMIWLRPDLEHPTARDLGVIVGTTPFGDVWLACEDSVAISSPSRSGKTHQLIIPILMGWTGPVVATSVRTELATETMEARSHLGPVAVFAPAVRHEDLVGVTGRLRWSLTSGCQDPTTALRRANALVANAAKGTENADFWQANAHSALAALLHAAAISGAGVDTLARWCADHAQAKAAVNVLKAAGGASAAWGDQLEAQMLGDKRTVSNIWATISSCVALPLMDPTVREALSPAPGQELDIAAFLAARGTLYVVGDSRAAAAPIVAALIEEVYAVAQELANHSPGNRLCPPVALVLDELNNIAALPSLPSMMSAGGGSGIFTVVVEQSRAQSEARWGAQTAAAIWDSATVKIVMGGITRESTLSEISAALGERTVSRRTTQTGRGPVSTSLSEQREPVLSRGEVHALERGKMLLIKAGAPALIMDRVNTATLTPAGAPEGRRMGRVEAWLTARATRRVEQRRRPAQVAAPPPPPPQQQQLQSEWDRVR
ncbi:type IV secretory system conjugative DNA transfer family protein [Actinomyces succiniciruminis]|uniref:Type IV secretory pathway VirD4 protein-like protein n=1 Tax=Actinomyces succiniciruminis TaxID=1522002 RepID=A0A1L7RQC7_9ACTO|nr:TraM recognition domain-containing protein [Actinomyces succiniciruminis]CED92460.1 Type IV secretory pathway VirD4 protein-like protein [Actinomyces succiniciruminis]